MKFEFYEEGMTVDLYIVKARCMIGYYTETLVILQNMEEKPKSYVGGGIRINKDKIGKLEEDLFIGSYKVALLNREGVSNARQMIKNAIEKRILDEMEKLNKDFTALNAHSLDSEIQVRIE